MDQDKFQTVSNTAFLFLPMDLVNMDYDNFQSRLEVKETPGVSWMIRTKTATFTAILRTR